MAEIIKETTEKKVTKAQVLAVIGANIENFDFKNTDITAEDVIAYVESTLEQMKVKNEKAKERAAEKRRETDELRKAVLAVVTDELQVADDILAALDKEDVTKSMVTSRLAQLIKDGEVTKEQVKLEGGKRAMAYKLA